MNGDKKMILDGIGRKISLRKIRDDSKKFFQSGSCVEEGQFKDDELEGFGRVSFGNGDQLVGWFLNGKLHGKAK